MDAWAVQAILFTQEIWAAHIPQPFSTIESHPVTSVTNAVEVLTTLQPPHSPSFPPSLTTQGPLGRPTAAPSWQNTAKNAVKHVENNEKRHFGALSKPGSIRPHPAVKDDWEWLKHHPPRCPTTSGARAPLVRTENDAKRVVWW